MVSRLFLWFVTAALFFLAWSFGPFSPLPFVALLPLLFTSMALSAGRPARWVVGSSLIAVVVWAIGYFASQHIFDFVLSIEFGVCTLLYVVVRQAGLPRSSGTSG